MIKLTDFLEKWVNFYIDLLTPKEPITKAQIKKLYEMTNPNKTPAEPKTNVIAENNTWDIESADC